LEEHLIPELKYDDGMEAITKNLVGRINSAAPVKTTTTAMLNFIHRAAGIEVPHEHLIPKKKVQQKSQPLMPQLLQKPSSTAHATPSHSPPSKLLPALSATVEFTESESDNDNDNEDQTPAIPRPFALASPSVSPSPEPRKRTTFLPSLYSGYISASDSSDPEDDLTNFAPLRKERKNRRGQRERQAIWLKKYGAGARHLRVEAKCEAHDRPTHVGERQTGDAANESPVKEKAVQDLHPSWVAKQRLREQHKAIINSNQSKKIIFD
jgi:BUD22